MLKQWQKHFLKHILRQHSFLIPLSRANQFFKEKFHFLSEARL